jgi:tetratricopeptide (TPR) repeat protein
MTIRIFTALLILLLSPVFSPAARVGNQQAPNSGAAEQLGKVSFPTSCSPAAQAPFERAVAFLHSFQYEQAEAGFSDVAQKDPKCAMAYWGKAMSLYHELWDHPGAETLSAGRADIEEAKALGAQTQRERDFINAAGVFFQDKPDLDYAARAKAYSGAMEEVYLHNPNDVESGAFYALSLIAIPGDDSDLTNRRKAIAILNKFFAREPDHPGLAHYLIHASDTPELAPQGLQAARRYAKIAPGSAHALHMPSHIFTRLGLWPESIESNIASAAAGARMTAMHLEGASYQLHAMDFLHYAYLQTGQVAKARQLQAELNSVRGATATRLAYSLSTFAVEDALEQHHWKDAAALVDEIENGKGRDWPAGDKAETYWVGAIGAARSGDAKAARADVEKLKQADAEWKAGNKGYSANGSEPVDVQEAEAWLALAEGKAGVAVKTLGAAAEQEDKKGVDSLTMPAREMLGDMLIELHQPRAALAAFEAALAESPNRFDGLYGAARAAEISGARAKAKAYYSKLEDLCPPGSDERPELREARTYLARNEGSAESGGQSSKPGRP